MQTEKAQALAQRLMLETWFIWFPASSFYPWVASETSDRFYLSEQPVETLIRLLISASFGCIMTLLK